MYIKHLTRRWAVLIEPEEVTEISVREELTGIQALAKVSPENKSYCVMVTTRRGETTALLCDSEEEAVALYERLLREIEKVVSYVSVDQRMNLGEVVPE